MTTIGDDLGELETVAHQLPPLSPRELEVLSLTALGLTNVQMAARLDLTTHAVKFHLASIFRKLGVGNRTEAAISYFRAAHPDGSPAKNTDHD